MNLLFVVDEFPFPPRNGVTIPVANFIDLFASAGHRVDLLWLTLDGSPVEATAAPAGVTACAQVAMRRTGKFWAVASELSGRQAVFAAWAPDGALVGDALLARYDVVWASPIRAFALWVKWHASLGIQATRSVAAVNDSYALTLRELSRRQAANAISRMVYRARAGVMPRIERRILSAADVVAVQSRREVDFFDSLFSSTGRPCVVELKNGVAAQLFRARQPAKYDLLFVGTLDAFYRPTLEWFVREVYSRLPLPRPSFAVVGRGASEEDCRRFADLDITYLPFVDDIYAIYLQSRILVAPIFKGYGTINKVIEAMAAGCVVVGDVSAFNGIEGFLAGEHGLVASTAEEFFHCIGDSLSDESASERRGTAARQLMARDFSWSSRYRQALAALEKAQGAIAS